MSNNRFRYAGIAAMLVLAIMSSASAESAQTELRARANKVINGIEAELRGDFRANPNPVRLNAELDNINLPVGKKVAFCLVQNGVSSLIGVGQVRLVGGIPMAEVERSTSDGATVPFVLAGDVLQARQHKMAPFISNPSCGTALLFSASFQ
jgi:hypothetical protein